MTDLLQRLHDSHISAQIRTDNWVVSWMVHDPLHSERARNGTSDTVASAEAAMTAAAVELFPGSKFAKSLEATP